MNSGKRPGSRDERTPGPACRTVLPIAGVRSETPAGWRNSPPRRLRLEEGASLVEFALLLPLLCLLLMGLIDFGRAYYLDIEVSNAAHAGALYGTQNSTDITGMQNAALGDAQEVTGMTATATYGCECSDGSSVTPLCGVQLNCAVNSVNYVQVSTSATYHPIFPWPGIPSSIALQGSAKLRAGP